MSGPQNAQDFIRALKAPSDPPHPGGPLKIDIATDAWANAQLYVPNKAEAIVEWILTRLLKDKSKDRSSNPVCDSRYWALLSRVLLFPGADKPGDHGRALRAWLVPLLNRVPIAPVILSYLEVIATEGSLDSAQHALVTECITVLWPLAVPKIAPETLLECFGATLRLVVALGGPDLSSDRIHALDDHHALSLIVSSYRTALSNAGSKRKQLYTLFLQKHLDSWLRVAMRDGEGEGAVSSLTSDVYDAGIETVLGLDILKPAADQKHESALADSLQRALEAHPGTVLRPLPRLFASYVQTVKRHKGALFGQGSSQAPGQVAEQLQVAAMAFYASCDALARAGEDDEYWRCRVALLEVVERENLLGVKDNDAKALLRQDGDAAVDALGMAWDEQHIARIDSAVQILSLLTRIDYDLMAVRSAVIFPRLAAIPSSVTSALHYLDLLLEYDSKTRNLPASIAHLSGAFAVQHLQRVPGGPKAAYTAASAGPLTSLHFLDRLSSAVHSFLTPGQVLETVGDISRTLQGAYERFLEQEAKLSADRGDGPRKKRKRDSAASLDRAEPEYCAVSFALVARTMVAVLRSMPLHTLTEGTRLEAQQAIGKVCADVALRALSDGLQNDRAESWHWQTVIVGALRLHYGLVRVPGLDTQARLDQTLLAPLLSLLSTTGIVPELTVETTRTLLYQCSLENFTPNDVLEKLLEHLESQLPPQHTAWSGKAHTLTSEAEAALALLHLVTDRWLPYFDTWCTPEQRKRFARILTNVKMDGPAPSASSSLSVPVVIFRTLHDAQFWELLGLRDAFLAQLNEQTAPLDEVSLSELLAQSSSRSPSKARNDVSRFVAAYDILLVTPPEYIPRQLQIELLKRGFAADVLTLRSLRNAKKSTVSPGHLLVIREFLRRTIAFLGSVENVMTKDFLDYLVEHSTTGEKTDSATDKGLSNVTMELIDMYQGALVRSAKRGSANVVVDLVNRYAESYATDEPSANRKPSLLLIDCVVREGNAAEMPQEIVQSLRVLYTRMRDHTLQHLPSTSDDGLDVPLDLHLLDTWSHVQTLRRWLKEDGEDMPLLGRPLSRRLLSWTGVKQHALALAPVVVSIMLVEAQAAPPLERADRLQYVIVVYLSLLRVCGQQAAALLQSTVGAACRTFSAEEFGMLLDLLLEALPLGSGLPAEDVSSLIRFSAVVLHDAPEGTSKICQAFTTKCLNLFADDERFTSSSDLRGEVVDFIVKQCNDRPASLRTADLSGLWSILRALLAGSTAHEPTTDATVFHGVVNILSALVRLRRDLVLNTLPHLGFVLRQLVSCLRSLRPQLGGKQRRLVMDTLPRWLAPTPAHALGAAESRALARLLTTLTTKTMVRTHGPGADAQKPESLVRPFSKHAAYVLTAYVEAVNDPLCFVPAPVRKELQPGLFALCEMLGEHNRDAMMVSALDAGGKATMKALWKEYEKQRYVGKG